MHTNNEGVSVSVVIPLFNGASWLPDQLIALANQVEAPDFEVVIADNGSVDGGPETAAYLGDELALAVSIIDASERRGVSHARNVGAAAARGDHLLFCDQDDRVAPGWISAMSNALDIHPAVGGAIIPVRESTGTNWIDACLTTEEMPWRELPVKFGFLPAPNGGNSGIRRGLFEFLGGYDVSYPYGGEDVDLYWRVQLAGCSVGFVEQAIVYYRIHSRSAERLRRHFNYARSAAQLHARFGPEGMQRTELRDVAREWRWLVRSIPAAIREQRVRRMWGPRFARRVGYLWGSALYRTFYP